MKTVQVEDLLKYRFIENLQYSPNGRYLAYQLACCDVKKNTYRRDIWLIEKGKPKQLTASLDAAIVGWDDDTHLILKRRTEAEEAGMCELFRLDVTGGEAMPWLQLPLALQEMKKVKAGVYAATAVIIAADPDTYLDSAEERAAKLQEIKAGKDYQVIDELPYWANGAGFVNGRRRALFIVQTDPELRIRRITAPYFDLENWRVQAGMVYWTGTERKMKLERKNRVYALDAETMKVRPLYKKKDLHWSEPFVMDGRLFAFASDHKEYGRLETEAFTELKDGQAIRIKKPERTLHNTVSGDTVLGGGKQAAVLDDAYITLATEQDHTEIWAYDSSFEHQVLYRARGSVSMLDATDKKIAFVLTDPSGPMEIYECTREGKQVKCLTAHNKPLMQDTYVAAPQVLDYESEGQQLRGWVLLPQDFDPKKKYPAVLDVHGGPRGVYGENFFHEMQVWAGKGYIVFFTNIRGSDGRGDAFADIRGEYGYVDYLNLMDFTDAVLQAYPCIDQDRVCMTGGSYGGFMANWIIGHTDRFCCTASQRSISNWVSMAFISDIGLWFGTDQNDVQNPYRDTEKFWDHSPLKYAENAVTPTLFIHSDEDYRCPLPEGMQMMQALANKGVETRMVIFHGENHELSRSGKPVHRLRRLNEITEWFEKHTK